MREFEVQVTATFNHMVEADTAEEAERIALEETENSKPQWYVLAIQELD